MLNRWSIILTSIIVASLSLAAQAPTTLKDAYRGSFYVGAAINTPQITGSDARGAAIVAAQFNSISPENVLKWERVHPKPGVYTFDLADKYVEFGEKNHMFIVGHNLIWHAQTPDWVFQDEKGNPLSREALLERMHDHIFTVVGRYKGRIQSWDVVNEAISDKGGEYLKDTHALRAIGEDYVERAFQFAQAVNTVQTAGSDANGNAGAAIFDPPNTTSGSATGAASSIAVALTSGSQIAAAATGGTSGDNTNVLKMIDLQNQSIINGATPTATVANLTFSIGNAISQATSDATATGNILTQLQNQQGSVEGVSLDEESSNLVLYQRSFEAAAKIISTVDTLMGNLLDMGATNPGY